MTERQKLKNGQLELFNLLIIIIIIIIIIMAIDNVVGWDAMRQV
jgi:hypothetical protein